MPISLDRRVLAGGHHHEHDEDEFDLLVARVVTIVVILISGLFIFLPYTKCMKQKEPEQEQTDTKICSGRLHQYSNCFAAGMLISLSLVHILPEALETYETYLKEHEEEDGHDHRRLFGYFTRMLAETSSAKKQEDHHDDHHDEHGFPLVYFLFVLGFLIMLFFDQVLFKRPSMKSSDKKKSSDEQSPQQELRDFNNLNNDSQIQSQRKDETERANPEAEAYEKKAQASTLFIFCLSIFMHTILEGLAIGVFREVGEMVVLAASVVIHKVPVAYTIGTIFLAKERPLCHWSTLFFFIVFIISTPLGVIIGAALNESGGLTIVIIQSLAGGTLCYLAACDFMIHQFHESNDIGEADTRDEAEKSKTQRYISLIKFSLVILGFAIIVTIFSVGPKHEH